MSMDKLLKSVEKRFDEAVSMPSSICHSIGYHSRLPDGCVCHSTREAIYYALALIRSGKKKHLARAEKVIRAVLALQETNPYKQTYGIWPWFQEEPLEKMAPPDWNWADFIGAALCHILLEHRKALSKPLVRETEAALERAAWSIFRRNVQPDYTNIALMGAAVTSAAGRILKNDLLTEYARERIKAFWKFTRKTGGLNEYNSPTYTFVALFETERILQLSADMETCEYAEKVRRLIWQSLAEHYHPATGQLAGPHSRAYALLLDKGTIRYLSEMTGADIPGKDSKEEKTDLSLFSGETHLPCPKEVAKRFRKLPEKELESTRRFIRREPDSDSCYGTTWMTEQATFGSISRGCTWVQAHPLIAYWINGKKPAVFHFNFLKNGREFSSLGFRTAQRKNIALTAFHPLTDRGDYHIHLDHPADQTFRASELVLRYSLEAENAEIHELSDAVFELRAGDWKAVVHVPEGSFDGAPIACACGKNDSAAYVDIICYAGPEKAFKFDESLQDQLAAAVEILPAADPVKEDLPERNTENGSVITTWRGLQVTVPLHGVPYD